MAQILAISGSLRSKSVNKTVLQAAALLAPAGVSIALFDGLGDLPHFNPDFEDTAGQAVVAYRQQLKASTAVMICSPEYAHGVPGVLKNALDWIVGSGELVDKPVALINASPHSTHAQASLKETVSVMSARLVDEACVTLPIWNRTMDAAAMAADPEISALLRKALDHLLGAATP